MGTLPAVKILNPSFTDRQRTFLARRRLGVDGFVLGNHAGGLMPKVVAVLDGQGGGIGSAIIRAPRERMGPAVEVWALGTNAIATSQMMRAGASKGASGETAVIHEVSKSQVVLGTITSLEPRKC